MFTRLLRIFASTFFALSLTWGFVVAWNGIMAEDGDLLTFTKWNELVAYIDAHVSWSGANIGGGEWVFDAVTGSGQMQFKTIVAGTWLTITSDSSEITISKPWASVGSLVTDNITVSGSTCLVTTIPHDAFMNGYAEVVTTSPGTEHTPTGTIDPDANSTWDANMINNNYTDLAYNNSSAWSANKSLPAVDLWASVAVWVARIYRWTPATYGTTDGTIQWSNDGAAWTDLVTGIVQNTGATGDSTDHTISGNWRYIRFFNVTGQNATWVVLSELEVFAVGSTTTEYIHLMNRDVEIKNNGGNLEVCNNEGWDLDIEINSLQ